MTRPELTPVDAAIIGAGFAGLSAAHALRAGGAKVLLLEAQEPAQIVQARYPDTCVTY